jgi:hypothetical protein
MSAGSVVTGQSQKNEGTKMYLVVVLGIIFCVIAYVRFFHKTSDATLTMAPANTASTVPSVAAASAPHLPGTDIQEPHPKEFEKGIVRDIFEPGRSVRIANTTVKTPDETRQQDIPMALSGLVHSGNSPVAIINGQFYHTGDQLGGYKIVRIGPKDVLVKSEDREITLRVTDYGQR